jgi:hypothetical protein
MESWGDRSGVDGIDGSHRHRVPYVGHDAQYPDLSPLLENIGHADGGGIIPPQGQVRIDDNPRRARLRHPALVG